MSKNKKPLAVDIFVFIVIVAIVYVAASFVSWQPNPKYWDAMGRVACILAIAYCAYLISKTKID